jgi:transposase-like protein
MRRRPRGRTVLVCPKCGSPKIALVAGSIVGQVYHCSACDYVGSLVLEQDLPTDASTGAADPQP